MRAALVPGSALVVAVSLAALAPAARVRAQDGSIEACGAEAPTTPLLAQYDALLPGARFRVTLRHDGATGRWLPAPALDMPLHHASALAFEGLALPGPDARTLELEIEAIERVAHGPRDGTFFFTYRVRVRSACWRPPT